MNAVGGQTYTIAVSKNNAGYNDWVTAELGSGTSPAQPASVPAGTSSAPTPAPRSNFETPEERAQRQVYIIRQSSISSAISALSIGAKAHPKIDEVLDVAKQFEAFVFGRSSSGASPQAQLAADFFEKGGDDLIDVPL